MAIVTWLLVAKYHEYQVALFSVNRLFHLSTDTIVTATIMSQYSQTGVGSIVYSTINAIGNLSTVFVCMIVGFSLDITVSMAADLYTFGISMRAGWYNQFRLTTVTTNNNKTTN